MHVAMRAKPLRIFAGKIRSPTFEQQYLAGAPVALHIAAEQFIGSFSGQQNFNAVFSRELG